MRPRLALLALAVLLSGCRGCPSGQPPVHLMRNMMFQPQTAAGHTEDHMA